MRLLKKEVESSISILLQTKPHWLINKDQLQEQEKTNNKRGSAIVITMSNKNMLKQLMACDL